MGIMRHRHRFCTVSTRIHCWPSFTTASRPILPRAPGANRAIVSLALHSQPSFRGRSRVSHLAGVPFPPVTSQRGSLHTHCTDATRGVSHDCPLYDECWHSLGLRTLARAV